MPPLPFSSSWAGQDVHQGQFYIAFLSFSPSGTYINLF
jgi:hypothetical protein